VAGLLLLLPQSSTWEMSWCPMPWRANAGATDTCPMWALPSSTVATMYPAISPVPPLPRSALVLDFDTGPPDQVRPPRPLACRPSGRSGQPGPRERPSCRGPAASRNGCVWTPWGSPSHFSRRPKFGRSGRILSTVRRPESGSRYGTTKGGDERLPHAR